MVSTVLCLRTVSLLWLMSSFWSPLRSANALAATLFTEQGWSDIRSDSDLDFAPLFTKSTTGKSAKFKCSVIYPSVHPSLYGAAREVEVDELRDHLEGVGLHLLQRVRVQPQLSQVRNVRKRK